VILRKLKGLEHVIGMSIVDPIRDERGWAFRDVPGTTADLVNGWSFLSEAYDVTDPGFEGRITVPVLWDTETRRVVSNESADVIVMLNEAWDEVGAHPESDYYPLALRAEIDAINERIHGTVHDGVYRAGFSTSREAYEEAVLPLFETLDALDARTAASWSATGRRSRTGACSRRCSGSTPCTTAT
jgi:putative glutathione S-transferase